MKIRKRIKYENKKISIGILIVLILVSSCIIMLYKMGLKLMSGIYVYHSWIDLVYILSWHLIPACMTIIGIIHIKSIFWKGIYIVSLVTVICIAPLNLAITYSPEHEDNGLIAQVGMGWHHTLVTFYEDINIFIMKKTDKQRETYDGSYDRYKQY